MRHFHTNFLLAGDFEKTVMADVSILPSSSHTLSLHLHRQNKLYHHLNLRRQFPRRSILSVHLSSVVYLCRSRVRDSNTENYSSRKFNFNNNDNEAESDYNDESVEQWAQLIKDYFDSIWIFKVFGSYGWMLPPILLSLLLANGLKAFLIALALPLSQSTFTFTLDKIQNKSKNRPKPKNNKNKNKKRRSRAYSSKRNIKFDEEGGELDTILGARKKKEGYQSWVSKNDVSVSSSDRNADDFGGWDEFDAGMDSDFGSSRTRKSSGMKWKDTEKSKLSSRWSENETPLLLRLLVSIFPFFSSWSKLL